MKLKDVKSGDIIIADNGFTCMVAGSKIVKGKSQSTLYVSCDEDKHFLDGQEEPNGDLVGFSWPTSQ